MNFCECKEDGYCPRYQREMRGRFRDICAGINCDLGTAAAFRHQWASEVKTISQDDIGKPKLGITLLTDQAPGDTLAMTAAIYSLHKTFPGKYETSVQSPHPEIFQWNPDVVPVQPDHAPLHMHYPAINESNYRGIHFMQGWCEFLGMALGIHIPLLTNKPLLYFPTPQPLRGNYWLVCSGGKLDFTAKLWGHRRYQEVVSSLNGAVRFVQVGNKREDHQPLVGVDDWIGNTTLRELFTLTRYARGVLCGVSLLMHIAAATDTPAIVIAGGREPVQWNAYPKQHYIHTVGALPCVSTQGVVGDACWRSRTVPLRDNTVLDRDTCQRPKDGVPECMTMIHPSEIVQLILRYNQAT